MEFKWDLHAGFLHRSLLRPGLSRQYTSADMQRVRLHQRTTRTRLYLLYYIASSQKPACCCVLAVLCLSGRLTRSCVGCTEILPPAGWRDARLFWFVVYTDFSVWGSVCLTRFRLALMSPVWVCQTTLAHWCITGLDLLGRLEMCSEADRTTVKGWILAQQVTGNDGLS